MFSLVILAPRAFVGFEITAFDTAHFRFPIRRWRVPIIAMTANAFAEDVRASEESGMQGHIPKPIDVNVMMSALTLVLGASPAEH